MADRKGFNSKEFKEEMRENKHLVDFAKNLTEGEIARIEEIRKFDMVDPGTPRYKVALLNDQLRFNFNTYKAQLAQKLWAISDHGNAINRYKVQVAANKIEEYAKDGRVLSVPEVETLIKITELKRDAEFRTIRKVLSDISGLVGHVDYIGKVIVSNKKFDKIVEETESELKKMGYDLFGELND